MHPGHGEVEWFSVMLSNVDSSFSDRREGFEHNPISTWFHICIVLLCWWHWYHMVGYFDFLSDKAG